MKTVSLRTRLGVHALNLALLSSTMFSTPATAQEALPTGGQVVSGSATIASNGTAMEINQSTDRMIANWQSFSIGAGNSVTFNQPNAASVALNRVIGQDPSRILGNLNANGQVFLINTNGIVIGANGQVQTGGFVGSTLNMSNADFLNDQYRFAGTGGSILNQGDLKGGVVALIAPRVTNEGTITGNTALAAGTDVTLDFDGDGLIAVEVGASSLATLVENKGLIQADGGIAILTAKGANDALQGVVNNTGTVEAQSLASRDGRILLLGDMENGEVNAAGTLQASFVETSAAQVNIADGLQVKTGGGTWLIDPTDFIVAASGGDMTGATLSSNLANGNVEITTLGRGSDSDIYVNDSVTWSSHTLTLDADRNITINAPLYGSGTAGLVLEYAQRSATGDYYINAPVNLASTGNFTIWNYNLVTNYTIITSLGTEGSSGDGTLQGMRGNLSGNYVLGSDIDASSTASWNGGQGFEPIGNELGVRFFDGIFDGLGHKIDNLTINRPSSNYVGLFGQAFSASIQNVGLERGSFKGNRYVGSIAGLHQSSSITNAWSSAEVSGMEFVGGLVGDSYQATVSKSRATGDVEGQINVGGLIGRVFEGSINGVTDSYATGNVSGSNYVGGLIGTNSYTEIKRVFASGNVTGDGHVGGLVGGNEASIISDSYATGSVTGTSDVGGLAGGNFRGSTISNSYAVGPVSGSTNVGGLVGQINSITGPNVVENSFWDTQTTGQSSACGQTSATCNATGLTTVQMKDAANFTAAGWDFTDVWAVNPAINNGYPYLRATVQAAVAPPPPPPPPPPPVALAVNDFNASFSTSTAPYQPSIALSGTGFDTVTEVRFTWTAPNGQSGTVTWDASNSFGGGRFVVGASGNTATIAPVLVATGDPSGAYQWTVTFVAGAQSISKNFTVNYTGVVTPPPPPPPPPSVPLSLTGTDAEIYSTDAAPYRPAISLVGQGLNGVTSITLSWTGPGSDSGSTTWNGSADFGDGKFEPSASGNTATLRPRVLASGDAPGTYLWTVTLTNSDETVTRKFTVVYSATQLEPPLVQGPVQGTDQPTSWLDAEHLQELRMSLLLDQDAVFEHYEAIGGGNIIERLGSESTWGSIPYGPVEETLIRIAQSAGISLDDLRTVHWGRNMAQLQSIPRETIAESVGEGWSLAKPSEEAFHVIGLDPAKVEKWVNNDGREYVYYQNNDGTWSLVQDGINDGTFNFVLNDSDRKGHVLLDVYPWLLWGTSPEDTTTYNQRLELARDSLGPALWSIITGG